MKKYFVPYEIALALREIGFDEPCFTYWVHDGEQITFATDHNRFGWSMIGFTNSQMDKKHGLCTAPLYDQVIDWFIKKHDIIIYPFYDKSTYYAWLVNLIKGNEYISVSHPKDKFPNRYEALNTGILKAIEIIKQKV